VSVAAGVGVFLLVGNWYFVPYMMSTLITDVNELNGTAAERVVVSLSEEGILWAAGGMNTLLPWDIVKSVEPLDHAVCIRAGKPQATLWIPSRAFASSDGLESFARIAQLHAEQVPAATPEETNWPQTPQQRRAVLTFAILIGGNYALAVLLLWLVRG